MVIIATSIISMPKAQASSEAACAIWLCLPGGFPSGCSAAYSEFKDRIEHGKPPLPELSSCMTGPEGKPSNGKYQMGYDLYVPCKDGFAFDDRTLKVSGRAICQPVKTRCTAVERYRGDCSPYNAVRRLNPRYVKMWVDGEYLGQFFY